MIGKLRKKFILVNMVFVCSIVLVALGILCANSYRKYEDGSNSLMRAVLDGNQVPLQRKVGDRRGERGGDPWPRDSFRFTPVCILTLNRDGTLKEISDNDLVMDQELAQELTGKILESQSKEGKFKEYSLSYMVRETPDGTRIAFADRSFMLSAIRNLVLQCLTLFAIASLAFLILSLYLSKWALNPVRRAWEQQNQFIADASHELKTPLTVILANLGILAAHRESTIESQQKWLTNTTDEASRMKQLVEQLLFLARSDAGAGQTVSADVDFSSMVWSCLLPFEPLAFEQKVELDSDITPGLSVQGNEVQLKQLTVILLDNALKYAGQNGRVQLRVYRQQEKICMTVHNTGEPIPKEELSHIFERFYRTDKSRARSQGGYGLGLAIAKTIVEQHQGKLTVESSREEGTNFKAVFHQEET